MPGRTAPRLEACAATAPGSTSLSRWHFLNLRPLPHQHGSVAPSLSLIGLRPPEGGAPRRAGARPPAGADAAGRLTQNVLPRPGTLDTPIAPPCASMSRRAV